MHIGMNTSDLKKIWPIVLVYEETGMTEKTEACLERAGFEDWGYVYREGVGSMAAAFNRGITDMPKAAKFVWFITNVVFEPEMPLSLLQALENNENAAAVHPGFDSDHPPIRDAKGVQEVNFIEWTAPLVRRSALVHIGILDEELPYVHFDLDWSYRARDRKWTLLVDGRHRLGHTYLHRQAPETISVIRAKLRTLRHPASVARMVEKYGPDWIRKTCPGGNCG